MGIRRRSHRSRTPRHPRAAAFDVIADPIVGREIDEQAVFYAEREDDALALRFVAEVDRIFDRLRAGHVVGTPVAVRFRHPLKRVRLEKFPFAIVFYVETRFVRVIALEAQRKQPGYWRPRLRGH